MFHDQIEYEVEAKSFEAWVSARDSQKKRPCVIIAHAWSGRDSFVEKIAEEIAELGYVGYALDVYGKGVLGRNASECSNLMTPLLEQPQSLRKRLHAAYLAALNLPYVNANAIAVIGYCFGGLCALEMHRSVANLRGAVSFHGLLKKAPMSEGLEISKRCPVLALHGADDPMVSTEDLASFISEMSANCNDWQLHQYGGVKHAFTNPAAKDESLGTVYNARADRRSWELMVSFLKESFSHLS